MTTDQRGQAVLNGLRRLAHLEHSLEERMALIEKSGHVPMEKGSLQQTSYETGGGGRVSDEVSHPSAALLARRCGDPGGQFDDRQDPYILVLEPGIVEDRTGYCPNAVMTRRFVQCDVFSPIPTQGNGLAVVVDSEGLSDAELQQFAAWTHLAESTFLLPPTDPTADYRVRIFTPAQELPFAGHPTLGSCAAWLHTGGVSKEAGTVRQECGIGIVEIDTSEDRLAFVAPPTTIEPLPDPAFDAITNALDIVPDAILRSTRLDNGPVWHVLQLATADDVLAVDSSKVRWPEFNAIGLIGAHPADDGPDYEVRMLAPSSGMSEDPITGSLNAALAFWLQEQGLLDGPLIISQGTAIGRTGRVYIRPDSRGRILIGGDTKILIEGMVTL